MWSKKSSKDISTPYLTCWIVLSTTISLGKISSSALVQYTLCDPGRLTYSHRYCSPLICCKIPFASWMVNTRFSKYSVNRTTPMLRYFVFLIRISIAWNIVYIFCATNETNWRNVCVLSSQEYLLRPDVDTAQMSKKQQFICEFPSKWWCALVLNPPLMPFSYCPRPLTLASIALWSLSSHRFGVHKCELVSLRFSPSRHNTNEWKNTPKSTDEIAYSPFTWRTIKHLTWQIGRKA